MEQRSIWNLAVRDIMCVVPLDIRNFLDTMSANDLRKAALRAAKIDSVLENDVIHPKSVERLSIPRVDVVGMEMVSGGQWILILRADGSVHLHAMQDLEKSVVSAHRPEYTSPRKWHELHMSIQLSGLDGNHLAVVYEHYTVPT